MESSYMKSYYNNSRALDRPVAFAMLMRKVYTWMALALAVTGLTAYYCAYNTSLVYAIASNSILFWGLMIAEFVAVVYLTARIERMSFSTAGLIFLLYSVLNGVTFSVIFLAYTMQSIASTFFITAGTFGAMSLIGYFTKKDLSGFGRFLMMSLIGLLIATVVNLFLHAGVLIFSGLTVYDTQKIKNMFLMHGAEMNESTMKLALMGSLTLYLDFINLFLYLLRIFGDRK